MCIVSDLPYNDSMPDQIVTHLIYFVVFWMNTMPSDTGVSEVYSPWEIVTGMKVDFKTTPQNKIWGIRGGKV